MIGTAHYNGQDVKVHLIFSKQVVTKFQWVNNEPQHETNTAAMALIELPDGKLEEVLATLLIMKGEA